MSIEVIGGEIARFLGCAEPEVLCLKGKWGVGKTFAWGRYVEQAKREKGIALVRYAFVSLYGINSLEQLKVSIVENTMAREQIGEPVNLEAVFADPIGSTKGYWRKALSKVPFLPGAKDLTALIQQLSFLAVRDQVVCLDDLERKGDGLKIKEVLGLATFLKEQRKCKVVLILNDGAFDVSEKDDFQKFFEKTVDSHVDFKPTAEECVGIALPEKSALHEEMRAHCVALGITNIRVIRRVERMARLLEPIIERYHPRARSDYIRALVVLGWSRYCEGAPKIEFIKLRRSAVYAKAGEKSADEEKWGSLLDQYGLRYFSRTAEIVLDSLERGFFDREVVEEDAQKLHDGYKAQQSEAAFHDTWRLYHNGFGDNQKELVETLSASFRSNVMYVSPMNANGTVVLLKDLGESKLASELIALYMDSHNAERFDRTQMFSENDITDQEFNEAVARKVSKVKDTRDPKEVLITIARQSGWGRKDIALLSQVSVDGYYEIFKGIEDGDELSSCIRMALSFCTIGGVSETERAIGQNARAALVKIAGELALNKRRVEKYGIKVE